MRKQTNPECGIISKTADLNSSKVNGTGNKDQKRQINQIYTEDAK